MKEGPQPLKGSNGEGELQYFLGLINDPCCSIACTCKLDCKQYF